MDNATFDRLARMLAGGASRRHTLRAIIAAALASGAAEELLAAKKNRGKNDRDKKKDDENGTNRGRDNKRGSGAANRASAQGKKTNENKKKRKRKNKRKPSNNNGGGGNACAGTPLRPGQTFLDCDFSERNLRGRDLNSSLFKDVDLTDADLCGANLESTSFTDSDASGANFTDVNFDSSSHDNTSYANANLTNATFRVATFNEVDFSNADLTGADFTGSTLSDVDFAGAIFCRTTQPNGNVDDSDCDICDNTCGLCEDCDDEDCTPPDCCPNPSGPGGICVDTETDPLNCGSCDRACFTNLSNACVDGECVCGNDPECSGSQTCCPGEESDPAACFNLQNDIQHCGACDIACAIPTNPCLAVECVAGQCVESPLSNGTECEAFEQTGVCCTSEGTTTCVFGAECCTKAQCGAGEDCCEGQCIDVQENFNNCGACNNSCSDSVETCFHRECNQGQCETVSDPNGEPCFGDQGICCADTETTLCFTDTSSNFDHCGGCDPCNPDTADACVNGDCVCGSGPACTGGLTCCNGQCVDTTSSPGNCGGCNQLCGAISSPCAEVQCIASQCTAVSDPEFTPCLDGQTEGICCGSGAAAICVANGACCSDTDCGQGLTCCSGQCVDTAASLGNCGGCGLLCASFAGPCIAGTACIGGQCQPVASTPGSVCEVDEEAGICCAENSAVICEGGGICCDNTDCAENPAGASCCANQCVDTQNDVANCGSCGNACSTATADGCLNGLCLCGDNPECTGTETCCSDECVDTQTHVDHCGACGDACLANADNCANGACVCGTTGATCPEADTCCNGVCLTPGPGVCCGIADCPSRPCNFLNGCTNNICDYTPAANGFPCGFGGECQNGACVGESAP